MPAGFDFPEGMDIWIPWDVKAERWASRREVNLLTVIGRVSSDATVEEAQAELDLIWQRLEEEYPENSGVPGLSVVSELEYTVRDSRVPLLVLMGAVVLVLLNKALLSKDTSFYNAAAGYFNSGIQEKALACALKASAHEAQIVSRCAKE